MVDASRFYVWSWDARPFPAFPVRGETWSDNGNWHYGHWLNGRINSPSVGDLINAILADHGLPLAQIDGADGTVHGYVVQDPTSPRQALEPLLDLFGLVAMELPNGLAFRGEGAQVADPVTVSDMISEDGEAVVERVRSPDHHLPAEAVLSFRDPFVDYQVVSARHARHGAPGSRQHTISFPGVLEAGQARALLGDWMRRAWNERERVSFKVAQPNADILPGAIVRLPAITGAADFLVTEIEDGLSRKVSARQVVRSAPTQWGSYISDAVPKPAFDGGQPLALLLDLPANSAAQPPAEQFRVAAWRKPWKSQAVYASPETTGYQLRRTLTQPADIGTLVNALPTQGVPGRIDHAAPITVELLDGEAASISRTQLLNGGNSVAIRAANGGWEIVQFETAAEIAPNVWRLSRLLRGQLGTEDAMAAGANVGAHLVVIDDAVCPAGMAAGESGLVLNWRIGPSGRNFRPPISRRSPQSGA